MSKPKPKGTKVKKTSNWVESWKPYNWGKKSDNQIKSKKDEIRTALRKKYNSSFTERQKDFITLKIGWYTYKTRPGIYKTFAFIKPDGGTGPSIVTPKTPPQP